jgi:hypothetical protein
MEKNKIYISGRITGLDPDFAIEQFRLAQIKCEQKGFEVINPINLDHSHDKKWVNFMRVDLRSMLHCTDIFMMKDWHLSKGANIEYNLAKDLEFKIHFE